MLELPARKIRRKRAYLGRCIESVGRRAPVHPPLHRPKMPSPQCLAILVWTRVNEREKMRYAGCKSARIGNGSLREDCLGQLGMVPGILVFHAPRRIFAPSFASLPFHIPSCYTGLPLFSCCFLFLCPFRPLRRLFRGFVGFGKGESMCFVAIAINKLCTGPSSSAEHS